MMKHLPTMWAWVCARRAADGSATHAQMLACAVAAAIALPASMGRAGMPGVHRLRERRNAGTRGPQVAICRERWLSVGKQRRGLQSLGSGGHGALRMLIKRRVLHVRGLRCVKDGPLLHTANNGRHSSDASTCIDMLPTSCSLRCMPSTLKP